MISQRCDMHAARPSNLQLRQASSQPERPKRVAQAPAPDILGPRSTHAHLAPLGRSPPSRRETTERRSAGPASRSRRRAVSRQAARRGSSAARASTASRSRSATRRKKSRYSLGEPACALIHVSKRLISSSTSGVGIDGTLSACTVTEAPPCTDTGTDQLRRSLDPPGPMPVNPSRNAAARASTAGGAPKCGAPLFRARLAATCAMPTGRGVPRSRVGVVP